MCSGGRCERTLKSSAGNKTAAGAARRNETSNECERNTARDNGLCTKWRTRLGAPSERAGAQQKHRRGYHVLPAPLYSSHPRTPHTTHRTRPTTLEPLAGEVTSTTGGRRLPHRARSYFVCFERVVSSQRRRVATRSYSYNITRF